MTDKIEVTQEDIVAALAHIGFDSIEDLHYWATNNAELKRFDDLAQAFAHHRQTAIAASMPHWQEALRAAYIQGATDVHNVWSDNPLDADFGEAGDDYAAQAIQSYIGETK